MMILTEKTEKKIVSLFLTVDIHSYADGSLSDE